MLELLLGQIPEAIYFAIFMILVKNIKEKKGIFIILMTLEYVLLFQALYYSNWSHILFFVISYIIMKILYKDKCNITDVFTLGIASLILITVSGISYLLIWKTINNYIVSLIIQRIILFSLLFIFRNKLSKIQLLYNKLWNRSKIKYKMKSTTFRALNLVIFNIMFYIINVGMIISLILGRS